MLKSLIEIVRYRTEIFYWDCGSCYLRFRIWRMERRITRLKRSIGSH